MFLFRNINSNCSRGAILKIFHLIRIEHLIWNFKLTSVLPLNSVPIDEVSMPPNAGNSQPLWCSYRITGPSEVHRCTAPPARQSIDFFWFGVGRSQNVHSQIVLYPRGSWWRVHQQFTTRQLHQLTDDSPIITCKSNTYCHVLLTT